MSANERQVNGDHYKSKIQHWDYVVANDLDYFQAQITKYVTRWKKKNGYQDLLKAQHFLEKYIELEGMKPKDTIEESLAKIGSKYPEDYQEQLSLKMDKMREDAMTGVPDHLREEMLRQQHERQVRHERTKYQMSTMPEPLQGAISPMLQKYWGSTEEPMSHGYVNQDGPDVR